MSNYLERVEIAILEAKRFIRRAETYKKRREETKDQRWTPCLPKESGAMRRSSMDLTRALADLRRSE